MPSGLFRFIAATGRNTVVANTFGSFALLILFALGGFVLSRGHKEMVDMGLLDFPYDVWAKCSDGSFAIVMRMVRNIVDTGRTVVSTIHQPSIDIFEAFDELFLMKRGGQEIYVGPLGHHSKHLIKYFEGIEGVNKIQDGYNPATWMLEVTTIAQESALGVNFADVYKNSYLYRRNKALIEELSKPAPGSGSVISS
ncbi:hypothetical protein PTKIN_Ptkin18bG0049600 [Pterospermum kingtungense]